MNPQTRNKPNPSLPDEVLHKSVDAVEAAVAAGFVWPMAPGTMARSAMAEACRTLGIARETLRHRLALAGARLGRWPNGIDPGWTSCAVTTEARRALYEARKARGATSKKKAKPEPEPSRSEIRDATFWRIRANALQRELDAAEKMAEELAGLRSVPIRSLEWAPPTDTRRGASVPGMFISDVHMGERIDPEEIAGINAFDPDICRARLRRYFAGACHVSARLTSDTDVRGGLLLLGGDLISGDIHEELRNTNSLTSHEQVAAVIEELEIGVRMILEAFGKVHVVSVPGNHSRVTHKPTAKLYSRASYDTLIAAMLSERFRSNPRATFQFGPDKDQAVNVFGFEHFLTHGDKMGTKGGMGFAGPLLPIVRGTKKIEAQQASIGRKPDYIWHGHYHITANAGSVLSNGSVPGYSEYASDLRASVEPPQQWLAILHSTWGMRERVPIQLEDPQRVKPRVSVTAA